MMSTEFACVDMIHDEVRKQNMCDGGVWLMTLDDEEKYAKTIAVRVTPKWSGDRSPVQPLTRIRADHDFVDIHC